MTNQILKFCVGHLLSRQLVQSIRTTVSMHLLSSNSTRPNRLDAGKMMPILIFTDKNKHCSKTYRIILKLVFFKWFLGCLFHLQNYIWMGFFSFFFFFSSRLCHQNDISYYICDFLLIRRILKVSSSWWRWEYNLIWRDNKLAAQVCFPA